MYYKNKQFGLIVSKFTNIILLILLCNPAFAQNEKDLEIKKNTFPTMGIYRSIQLHSEDFKDICEINVEFREGENEILYTLDNLGRVSLKGFLRLGKIPKLKGEKDITYLEKVELSRCQETEKAEFLSAYFFNGNSALEIETYNTLNFTTIENNQVQYRFSGEFLKKAEFNDGVYIKLRGTLIKLQNNEKVAETELSLYEWSYL